MLKPNACKGCPLYTKSFGFSVPDGQGTSGVVIVGEALGREEFLDGMPFRPKAPAGAKLEGTIRKIGASRNQFRFWNIIACNPPHNLLAGMPYEQAAIAHCSTHFEREVGKWQTPHKKTILALGNIPLKTLTGYSGIADEKQSIRYLRGYPLESKYGIVIPAYHPSYLIRGMQHLTPTLENDLRRALAIATGRVDPFADVALKEYIEHPSIEDCEQFIIRCKDNPKKVIAYDIETAQASSMEEDERSKDTVSSATITQIQFSLAKHEAIVLPWSYPFINYALQILSLPNPKAGFNCYNFDNKVLYDKGVAIAGPIHDVMWMFKHWQPKLERNLQSVSSHFGFPYPWKHMFESNVEWYGAADVDSLHYILDKLPKTMMDFGAWESYNRHVRGYYTILKKASDHGIPVNLELWQKLFDVLKAKIEILNREILALVPSEILPLTPKVKKDKKTGEERIGYVKEPKALIRLAQAYAGRVKRFREEGKELKSTFSEVAEKKLGLVRFGTVSATTGRKLWCKLGQFKASQKQITGYLKYQQAKALEQGDRDLAKLYEVPKVVKKGVEKETTGKDVLQELAEKTQDDMLLKVLESRSIAKMLSNDLPNWKPFHDGAVHTEWHFGPPTGQMGSRTPNVLNASKHTDNGQLFRRIIEAPQGYTFVEFDKRSFHVAMMGFVAKSVQYIRFSQLDPHSIFTSWIIPPGFVEPVNMEEMSDDTILGICKKIKKHPEYGEVRQKVAKPSVLGNQLGLGPMRLHRANKNYIPTVRRAKYLQQVLATKYPEVEEFKEETCIKADRQSFLTNYFGRVQRFYEVFKWVWDKKDRAWRKGFGSEHDKAIGFEVQSNAFDMLIAEILTANSKGYCEKYNFVNTIHDSLVFMPPIGLLDSCIADIGGIMVSPCKVLTNDAAPGGLKVGVEYSVGRNWQKWHETGNPEGMREIGVLK